LRGHGATRNGVVLAEYGRGPIVKEFESQIGMV